MTASEVTLNGLNALDGEVLPERIVLGGIACGAVDKLNGVDDALKKLPGVGSTASQALESTAPGVNAATGC